MASCRAASVSIHAPARGATPAGRSMRRRRAVSIHAPARGATVTPTDAGELVKRFDPRPRAGGDCRQCYTHVQYARKMRPRRANSGAVCERAQATRSADVPGRHCNDFKELAQREPARAVTARLGFAPTPNAAAFKPQTISGPPRSTAGFAPDMLDPPLPVRAEIVVAQAVRARDR